MMTYLLSGLLLSTLLMLYLEMEKHPPRVVIVVFWVYVFIWPGPAIYIIGWWIFRLCRWGLPFPQRVYSGVKKAFKIHA
jgi:hypothetical protein